MDIRNWLATAQTTPEISLPGLIQSSCEGFFDFLKTKRPNFNDEHGPELHDENRRALQKTYLNDGWLAKRKYAQEPLALGRDVRLLTDKGKEPKDILGLLERAVTQHRRLLDEHYRKVDREVQRGGKSIRKFVARSDWEFQLTEAALFWVGDYVNLYKEPLPMKVEIDAGGISNKRHPINSIEDVYEAALPTQVTKIPALDKDGVKRATRLILELFELSEKELEYQTNHWLFFFGHIGQSVRHSNVISKSNPWYEVLVNIEDYVNPGITSLYCARDALIRAIGHLIDRSVK